ncbi:DUF1236 domain-containing protein [Bosea caraganae]|uniref:DUF1236 domain-containing protein n=1 Tax=Bosea caraganae TaxID=2763117 RepID=A0A370KYL4_9HYPH|nr:DUF1236 domain-containing protein [Bosea caraganae]RDJ19712.1 DUF1236 domain-containing protein [Bosea caraganae]RDJ24356.1 DUF1236 domain-containing protein [Bosea caraganae]
MMKTLVFAAALAVLPITAFAQSSGPVVRDPTGGATRDPALGVGTVQVPLTRDPAGGTMVDDTPRFRTYVMEQGLPSYSYDPPIAVGTILPDEGVAYREVPVEYGAQGYRYTVVNGRAVVVEPRTRRVIQIIN